MAGWQTPDTFSKVMGGDLHPDSLEGRKEVWVKREDGYIVVMQAWRHEQMVKQAGLDSAYVPMVISEEEALPIVKEQDRINLERVNKSDWKRIMDQAKAAPPTSLEELEARIEAQDVKLDAILAALAK